MRRVEVDIPLTPSIAFIIAPAPIFISAPSKVGPRELLRMYNVGKSERRASYRIKRRRVLMRVLRIVVRERVPESVTSAWTRNAYGAGEVGSHGQGASEKVRGSMVRSGNVVGLEERSTGSELSTRLAIFFVVADDAPSLGGGETRATSFGLCSPETSRADVAPPSESSKVKSITTFCRSAVVFP